MPGTVLIYYIAPKKHTNLSIKIIRGEILKGFAAWLLNERFGSMGKQNQTHTRSLTNAWVFGSSSGSQRPHSQFKVQKVNEKGLYLKTNVIALKVSCWIQQRKAGIFILSFWSMTKNSWRSSNRCICKLSLSFPVRHGSFESIGRSAFPVIGCKRSLMHQKKFSKMQHDVLLSP